jgi:hypothetical protein
VLRCCVHQLRSCGLGLLLIGKTLQVYLLLLNGTLNSLVAVTAASTTPAPSCSRLALYAAVSGLLLATQRYVILGLNVIVAFTP